MAFSQHQRRRNAVRFELQGDLEMDRLQFSRNILQGELGFQPIQLDYLFAMPGKKVFEVVFATYDFFEHCMERYRRKKANDTRFANIHMQPLSERDTKTVTIIMYTEIVTTPDINTWLSFYCDVRKVEPLKDQDGILTGARRAYVRLRRDQASGQLRHLPSNIQLGRERGSVFYQGQPKMCRKCGSLDHLAATCNATYCSKCRTSAHSTRECMSTIRCNLCGSEGHTFSSCPHSYANRVSRRRDPDLGQVGQEDNQGVDVEPSPQEEVPAAEHQLAEPTPQEEVPAAEHQLAEPPPQEEGPAAEHQLAESTQVLLGAPSADNTGPVPSAAAEDLDQPGASTPISRESLLDWSATPVEYRPASDDNIGLVSVPPRSRTNSTAMSSEECRDILDAIMLRLPEPTGPATPADDGNGKSTSQKRQLQLSSGDSADFADSQVWPSPSSANVSFIDSQSLDLFSSATQMKGADEDADWEMAQKKKGKKPRNSPSPAPDPAPALDPFHGLPPI